MGTEAPGAIDCTKIYHFIKAQGSKESSEGLPTVNHHLCAWLH